MSTIWECKIGVDENVELPMGADYPMRVAIKKAFNELTGREPEFTFSGWGADLTASEKDVVAQNIVQANGSEEK